MKVIDIENVQIIGKNKKYIKCRSGRLILSKEYRDFKKLLSFCCKKEMIESPYSVSICLRCYHDIDASIQVIFDAMKGIVIDDDRNILELHMHKDKIKRGTNGSIKVFVSTYNGI